MADVSPVVGLGGYAGAFGVGLFIAQQIIAGYKRARFEAKKRELGIDDLTPAAATIVPPAPTLSSPKLPPPAAAAAPPELSRIALNMIEELQLHLRRLRESQDRLEIENARQAQIIESKNDQIESQAQALAALKREIETLRRDIATGRNDGQSASASGTRNTQPNTHRDHTRFRGSSVPRPGVRPPGGQAPR